MFFVAPCWTTSSQDNPLAKSTNSINIRFSATSDMPEASTITVSGLFESATPTDMSFPVTTTNSFYVSKGVWYSNGTLILKVDFFGVPANSEVLISFDLVNPNKEQSFSTIYLGGDVKALQSTTTSSYLRSRIQTATLIAPNTAIFGVPNGSNPLETIFPFAIKNISQNTSILRELNRITVQIITKLDFPTSPTSKFTIQGLVSTASESSSSFPIAYPDGSNADWGTVANWQQTSGTLILTPTSKIVSGKLYTFFFDMKNPSQGQFSPDLYIAASTATLFQTENFLMDKASGVDAPLFITDLKVKTISQSSSNPGAVGNVLTINLQSISTFTASGGTLYFSMCCLKGASSLSLFNPAIFQVYSWDTTSEWSL